MMPVRSSPIAYSRQHTEVFPPSTDQIQSDAIARFVARATGFDVVADDARVTNANSIRLNITFGTDPPQSVLEAYGAEQVESADSAPWWLPHHLQRSRRLSAKYFTLSLTVKGTGARNPRQVLGELQKYNPALMEESENAAQKRVREDVYYVASRTAIIGILTIPVLVFVWAELPLAASTKYGVALALSTVIVALSWPIFSASIRSIYYIRQADLGLLVTVSVALSYLFSVVAFGYEAAGQAFSEPFFETVSLLLFLIYVGRAIQATTRQSTGAALRSLRQLQCQEVNVIDGKGGLERIDAR